eukprot:CAMPEP_0172443180 /NCGR_PEP_ID=MMETSP1065-20121228/3486_1 /TAXON_ID=265537 /ORGANISM="Amphiprora paludosa, Strain CCMP125" /LENGTH=272 /DNA_ID=CAMNT_0013193321 /DNA_START=156 /DNA_END=974 /DNA_ORIENTATION=+
MADDEADTSNILPKRTVFYCGACGMPLEYCEYGPDFETHCNPWLKKHDLELYKELRGNAAAAASKDAAPEKPPRPENPWTYEERLTEFYKKYVPEKLDNVPALLEKYAGKEEKLFQALVQKYGEEPEDPYDAYDSEEEDEDGDDVEEEDNDGKPAPSASERRKRRGAAAKHDDGGVATRVIVQKIAQKKRRQLTVITGMETVPGLKLKDASKAFSKKFAGSSSVKKTAQGADEIIIQGDHVYDVAEMIVDKFNVPDSAVFIDIGDGEIVPLR